MPDDDFGDMPRFAGLPSLDDLMKAQRRAHDEMHMHHNDFMARLFALVENLSDADAFTLRQVCLLEKDSASMNFVDGLTVGHMRWQRGLDPETGKSIEAQAADIADAVRPSE